MKRLLRGIFRAIGFVAHGSIVFALGMILFAGFWMQVNDQPFKADYILPLAGDDHRLFRAAELFHAGYAPTVLISNAKVNPPTRLDRLKWEIGYPKYSDKEYKTRLYEQLGLPSSRLEHFGTGHISTAEEAEALRDHLNGQEARLLVVTSPYHARRAKMIFEETLPECTIQVVTNREGEFGHSWWRDQEQARYIVLEFAKTLHYIAGGVYRSTDTH